MNERQMVNRVAAAVFTLIFAWPYVAWAHERVGESGGFLVGFLHPFSGLDHMAAMVAVGLWGAQLGPPAVWALPVTFPIVMAFGGALGIRGVPIPGVELGIALSALALGIAILWEVRPPIAVAAALVGLFAIFHGHAHGGELPAGASRMLYSLGFVIATGSLHACGISLGLVHRWSWGRILLRACGGSVALLGVYFVVMRFA
jgi:urease accessory protein